MTMQAGARSRRQPTLKQLFVAGILLGIPLIGAVAASSASAHGHHRRRPKPAVSFSLARRVTAGAPISFTWTASHLGKDSKLVIQQPEGTAHTWRSILRLRGNGGSGELPGVALGKYRYRLAALQGRKVLAQKVAGTAVFGEVPFSTLLSAPREPVFATPSTSFPYVMETWGASQPALSVEHNHCLSVHIAFVASYYEAEESYHAQGTATVTVVQESREPKGASAPFEAVGSLDAELVPGQSWAMNTVAQRSPEGAGHLYLNGYAICDSTEPFRS